MPLITVSALVTRTELALAALQLETPNYCRVVEHGPGTLQFRTTWVESPFAHGKYPTASVKELTRMPLRVRILGTTQAELSTRLDELYDCFSQFTYELTVSLNGTVHKWTCWSADITPGESGVFNKVFLHNFWQDVVLDIPRHPIPITGVY